MTDDRLLEPLVTFVDQLAFDDLPTEAVRTVERAFVDTIGVTLAGSQEETAAIASTLTAGTVPTSATAGVVGGTVGSATDAAFVNATSAHALDFDDSHGSIALHPSSPLVASLLAVCGSSDTTDDPVDGRDLITAYVAGFETQTYLADPITPDHQRHGWHPTGTIGGLGAAAAIARLRAFDRDETRHALNIAASSAAGLRQNFGSMTKPMHAGQAARAGVTAGLLAGNGFTANTAALSADRGFVPTYNRGARIDPDDLRPLDGAASLVADGILFKKYPACGRAQTGIEIASTLSREHGIRPSDVASVRVRAAGSAGDALAHSDPETGREAKFSMEYSVARAIQDDGVRLESYEDDAVRDPTSRDLLAAVTFQVDPDLPYTTRRATVEIETTDGNGYRDSLEYPPGHPENPMSDAEIEEKYRSCATRAVDEETAGRVYDRLDSLRTLDDVERLLDLLGS